MKEKLYIQFNQKEEYLKLKESSKKHFGAEYDEKATCLAAYLTVGLTHDWINKTNENLKVMNEELSLPQIATIEVLSAAMLLLYDKLHGLRKIAH